MPSQTQPQILRILGRQKGKKEASKGDQQLADVIKLRNLDL